MIFPRFLEKQIVKAYRTGVTVLDIEIWHDYFSSSGYQIGAVGYDGHDYVFCTDGESVYWHYTYTDCSYWFEDDTVYSQVGESVVEKEYLGLHQYGEVEVSTAHMMFLVMEYIVDFPERSKKNIAPCKRE